RPKVEVKIDFDGIGRRSRQVTRVGDIITNLAVSPDSRSVAFVTSGVEGGRRVQSIWSVALEGGVPSRVVQSGSASEEEEGPRRFRGFSGLSSLQYTRDGRQLYYRQGSGIYVATVAAGPATAETPATGRRGFGRRGGGPAASPEGGGSSGRRVSFAVRVEIDHRAERKQVLGESWRVMKHHFYDADMHGVDWNKVKATYEPLLDHVA